MGDEEDAEPIDGHPEFDGFEQELFAAIREFNRLNAEIDNELGQLANGQYEAPSVPEPGSEDDGAP